MNTKHTGDTSVSRILAKLIETGHTVSLPFGDNARYDLICDFNGQLLRLQCKTGRLSNGAIVFPVSSSAAHRGSGRRAYHGEIDAFAVFCPQTAHVLLVPMADIGSCRKEVRLRVHPSRNRQLRRIRLAQRYADLSVWPPARHDAPAKCAEAPGC